ncbi:MAG: M20 family metallopeptidase [Candidatus Odinarchaeota archaeon]
MLDLIRIDTSKGTEEAASLIRTFLEERGIKAWLQQVKSDNVNIIANIQPKTPIRGKIVLSGHFDVVPPGNLENWDMCEPFEPQERGDLICGRGAADMKGGVVAIIGALLELAEKRDLEREIVFLGTAEEESGMHGAKKFIKEYSPRNVDCYVITEPTDLKVGIAEKGIFWLELLLLGKSSHGSRPELGRNAIKMVTRALELIEKQLPREEHALLGRSTMNLGVIRGGTKVNMVPDECVVEIDFRLIPGISPEHFLTGVKQVLDHELGSTSFQLAVKNSIPAVETPVTHPFVSSFRETVRNTVGKYDLIGLTYATDAAILSPFDNRPFLIFGPGNPEVIHAPDEYVDFNDVLKASHCLVNAIKYFGTLSR